MARQLLRYRGMANAVLAVPLLGEDVAPRFCSARELLLVVVSGTEVRSKKRIRLDDLEIPERLGQLADEGTSVLLCSGFGRRWRPSAELKGIRVIAFLSGRAEELVAAYLADDLDRFQFPRPQMGVGQRRRNRLRGGAWSRSGRSSEGVSQRDSDVERGGRGE